MSALESRLTDNMDEQFIQMKQDLEQETSARTMLEERVVQLKSKQAIKKNTNAVRKAVDKSIAVIGRFVEETEKLAHDLLKHVHGFHEMLMVDGHSIVSLAQFDSPATFKFRPSQRLRFLRQNRNQVYDIAIRKLYYFPNPNITPKGM